MSNISGEKQTAFDFVDRNADAVATLADSVFYFGELGMQEYESAGLMTELLEQGGFEVLVADPVRVRDEPSADGVSGAAIGASQ